MKTCRKCNLEKELTEFHKHKNTKDGYRAICAECILGHIPHSKEVTQKKCKKCSIVKLIEDFPFNDSKKKYRRSYCKECSNKQIQEVRAGNPNKEKLRSRKKWLWKKYGITLEEYDQMYLEQGGRCKICTDPLPILDVDHCHASLLVRGLLCGTCNTGLGHFKDSPDLLIKASQYLIYSRTKCKEV